MPAQADGTGKFSDNHPSPDYIGGFIQFANGVRGIVECGEGAPDVPEVDYWWRKARVGAQGSEGFAEALTGGGWRAVTRQGASSGPGCMDYEHDMGPYVQEMVEWLDDDTKVHPCNGESAFRDFEIMMAHLPLGGPAWQSQAASRPGRARTGSAEESSLKVAYAARHRLLSF